MIYSDAVARELVIVGALLPRRDPGPSRCQSALRRRSSAAEGGDPRAGRPCGPFEGLECPAMAGLLWRTYLKTGADPTPLGTDPGPRMAG